MNARVQAALEHAGESALNHFGIRAQMIKTCEELGELTTALCKRLNSSTQITDLEQNKIEMDRIIDEVADVLIMANQMQTIYGKDAVEERILFKLNRTMEFIRSRDKGTEKEGNA